MNRLQAYLNKYPIRQPQFPEDIWYLKRNVPGIMYLPDNVVESLWHNFSEYCYSASWLDTTVDNIDDFIWFLTEEVEPELNDCENWVFDVY